MAAAASQGGAFFNRPSNPAAWRPLLPVNAARLEKENLDTKNLGKQPAIMNSLNRFADPVYCVMRLIAGLMFMCHGLDKIFGTFGGKVTTGPLMQIGGWLEILCGALIAIGLLTRIAAFIASGEMAVAFFMMHAKASFLPIVNHGELAVVYCWLFLFIFLYGPGRFSIDAMIKPKSTTPVPPV